MQMACRSAFSRCDRGMSLPVAVTDIQHIVEVFFERVPIVPRMIHKPTFKANLQLPPTHWKFPVCPCLARLADIRLALFCTVSSLSLLIICP